MEAPISPLTAAEVAELNEVYRKHASVGVGDINEMPSDAWGSGDTTGSDDSYLLVQGGWGWTRRANATAATVDNATAVTVDSATDAGFQCYGQVSVEIIILCNMFGAKDRDQVECNIAIEY